MPYEHGNFGWTGGPSQTDPARSGGPSGTARAAIYAKSLTIAKIPTTTITARSASSGRRLP